MAKDGYSRGTLFFESHSFTLSTKKRDANINSQENINKKTVKNAGDKYCILTLISIQN